MSESETLTTMNNFSAFDTPLETGVNLIEASAGTGKTYSIAMLVLRFVVEKRLNIEEILVVTFTKAATQELKTRIRTRLQDLRRYLSANADTVDLDEAFMIWADQLNDKERVIIHVTEALASIDNAAIFTIHGFCQRMLKQHALESGQLFDAELTANLDALQLSLAEDYWRKQMYQASALKAVLLGASFSTPASLLASVRHINQGMKVVPAAQDVDGLVTKIEATSSGLARVVESELIQPLADLIAAEPACFKDAFITSFQMYTLAIAAWVSGQSADVPILALESLSFNQLLDGALNGNKFRKTKLLSAEERKRSFLEGAGLSELVALDELINQVTQLSIALRLGLFEYIQSRLDTQKDELNVLSYDDLITRLAGAVAKSKNLTASLQGQFGVALIDEFQDTDQQQWSVFSTIYHTPQHYLYLIGDPKQAVYKFRGADIYSYLEAKTSANRAFTLEKNFRSAPVLLHSINHLYSKSPSPFLIKDISYHPVQAGKSTEKAWADGDIDQGLVLWYLEDNSDHKEGYWSSGVARQAIRSVVVNETVRLLQQQGSNSIARLGPKDIAILVRGNEEAANYQRALQLVNVPAVINSKNSVFDCEEARYLLQLLTSIERPGDLSRLRQALVLPWFDLDGQAFDSLCRDDFLLQQYVMEFQDFQLRWQEFGLMAMMSSMLDHYQIMQNISRDELAERRITNLHHLLEILQQVALEERLDAHKTVEWLVQAIQGEFRKEGTELRLEQDHEAVSIVTIHSAKGLEYPVVFVPELWYERPPKKAPSTNEVVTCHVAGKLVADVGSGKIQEHFEQAQFEQQAEDLRLLYVAITRAANLCYLPWATVRTASRDNASALAYLLDPHPGDGWQAKLSNLADTVEGIRFDVISANEMTQPLSVSDVGVKNLQAKKATRLLKQDWRMSSYSSLAYLSQSEQELPQDKSQEPLEVADIAEEPEAVVLPKGAHTGNVLHDLLEHNSFKKLKDLSPTSKDYPAFASLRDKSCVRYGLNLEPEAEKALDDLLIRSVVSPLDSDDDGFCLANLSDEHCLKEMAFYFSINELQTQAINQQLAGEASYQSLSTRQLSGQLTGFIDLICQYQGRYYVMDYKSNSLPEYGESSLTHAMQHHNYGLQYFIYSVVLHHYLQQRLPHYNYDDHFGGVRYLFLRGMDKAKPMRGVFVDKPSLQIIEGLSDILKGGASQ